MPWWGYGVTYGVTYTHYTGLHTISIDTVVHKIKVIVKTNLGCSVTHVKASLEAEGRFCFLWLLLFSVAVV